MVNPPPDDMEPPRSQFRQMLEDARDLLSAQGTDTQLDPLRTALGRLEADGNDAFTTKNHKKWAATNESLAKLHARILSVAGRSGGGGGGDRELPPTPILKDHFKQELDGLRAALHAKREELAGLDRYPTKFKPRCDTIESTVDQLESSIDQVDDELEPKQALGQLQLILPQRTNSRTAFVRPESMFDRAMVMLRSVEASDPLDGAEHLVMISKRITTEAKRGSIGGHRH